MSTHTGRVQTVSRTTAGSLALLPLLIARPNRFPLRELWIRRFQRPVLLLRAACRII